MEGKKRIKEALAAFGGSDLTTAGITLFKTLGYTTTRTAHFPEKTARYFTDNFVKASASSFSDAKARTADWKYVDLLFQLTKDEASNQQHLFESGKIDDTIIESYLFFIVDLHKDEYARGELAGITREVNKTFPMPVMVLFRHGKTLTLAVIDRRVNKREAEKDVLAKVTLIKDIRIGSPHRAHLDILFDLSFDELQRKHGFRNFVELHRAWRETLDISALNKRFYLELSNWYFWAMDKVSFPDDGEKNPEVRNATSLIRLITRIIFVWFIREKDLIPERLFDKRELALILRGFLKDESSNTFYPAILQNLFFATLNQKMHEREFAAEGDFATNRAQYSVKNLYRHARLFSIPGDQAAALFKDIPFLNGGLFDCLDNRNGQNLYIDGFSRNPAKQARVPDRLFFAPEQEADLNEVYGTKGKKYSVRGLIDILNAYKFTIAENTPVEEEVALDPELLGKVFENLLASYNPETRTTARNKTGSFYTPREIVNFMVDESLKAYLAGKLTEKACMAAEDARAGLDILFMYTERSHAFTEQERDTIIEAIDSLKILDPACGSGAYPMGILHKLVYILHKLDPYNELWKNRQIAKALQIDDPDIREKTLDDIESAFSNNELDYGRKLYLIENCIYGSDIQPIAVQIAKLRFFISLVIDQKRKPDEENQGIRSLPNLETKFVAADSLIGLTKDFSDLFHDANLRQLESELKVVRHQYFGAKSRWQKKAFQDKDREVRRKIVDAINGMLDKKNHGFQQQIDQIQRETMYYEGADLEKRKKKIQDLTSRLIDPEAGQTAAQLLSRFDPYDQNASAPFFDPDWMFGVADGFDVVIGNPPYIQVQNFSGKAEQTRWEKQKYAVYAKTGDVYCLFYEVGYRLLASDGRLCYITSNKWMRAAYGKAMRKFFMANGGMEILIDFGDSPIFENATTYTNILLWRRAEKAASVPLPAVRAYDLSRSYTTESDLDAMLASKGAGEAVFSEDAFVIAAGDEAIVKRRIEAVGKPLKDWGIKINRGILTGLNEAFIIDQSKYDELVAADPRSAEILKPILRGRDIKRYKAEWAGLYLVATFPALHLDIDRYPAVRDYLKTFGKALEQSGNPGCRKKTNNKWFEVQDTIAYWEEFEKNKLIWPEIAGSARFVFDNTGAVFNNKAYMITSKSIKVKFLTGLLNSSICRSYIEQSSTDLQGQSFNFSAIFVEKVPIPDIPVPEQLPYEVLVDCIQFAREHDLNVEADTLEAVVDVMAYGLYFPEEMKAAGCFINDRIAGTVKPFTEKDTDEFKTAYVGKLAGFCRKDAVVYQGLIQSRNVGVVRTISGGKEV